MYIPHVPDRTVTVTPWPLLGTTEFEVMKKYLQYLDVPIIVSFTRSGCGLIMLLNQMLKFLIDVLVRVILLILDFAE